MNTLDLVLILPILFGIFQGYKDGLVQQVSSFLGFVASFFLSLKFSGWVNSALTDSSIKIPVEFLGISSLLIAFILAFILIRLSAKLLSNILSGVGLGIVGRLGGAILGGVKFLLIICFILIFYQKILVELGDFSFLNTEKSQFYQAFLSIVKLIFGELKSMF